ncbi:MAG: ABC transporter permease [Acidobacteriota bacterium]|jgi:putative ABC transport system permease protein|nr:ABC transporter permease [Acidobacteriota bacterium]
MIAVFFRNLFRDLVRQPLRTLLTLSGVMWGTFAVVLLLAFGNSVQRQSMKNMRGMGDRLVVVWPGVTTMTRGGFTKGRRVRMTPEQVMGLRDHLPGIENISPEFRRNSRLRHGREEFIITIRGVGLEYEAMRNTIPAKGRFLNRLDLERRRRVCFIGDTLAKDLFKDEEPVGGRIVVEGVPFTVVGVMREKIQPSNYGGNRDTQTLFLPWTTFTALYGDKYVGNFIFSGYAGVNPAALEQKLRRFLSRRLEFHPDDKDALFIWNQSEMLKQINVFFTAFTIFLGIIGSFTLLVGGVGVASIMMVVVEERTREIGIKLAVGAKRRGILAQFFSESLVIILMGGMAGFLAATLLINVLPAEKIRDYVGVPQINPTVGIATVLILMVIGVVAGIAPARRAASTNPIEALRS